ncbi:protein misato homolog 1 isoform X2 [Amborella trichopoda]|uniref:protein misato homolog 1 isoform X2 n=1 Tax=Amborella trichopoda TaxID=13333 RepID=UPI0005D2F52E|nr:protein misato homolog 1 isoform X2 [Amborella trichopoda]|eukprot:XP_020528148.1 protein misato homolog 1 isoform X2 [Amborella trichopoda]
MREIVTIQVGGISNYIGSHFWNFQDELLGLAEENNGDPVYKNTDMDMDVFYRAGETHQGIPTYTPRLLSIDMQGALGSLRASGSLYEGVPSLDASSVVTWKGKSTKHVSEPHKKNLFLQSLEDEDESLSYCNELAGGIEDNQTQEDKDKQCVDCLENGVEFWTDYSKVHFHPQSLFELNGLWRGPHEFNNYGTGREVFSECLQGEEISTRLRFFVEECDHMQGFQFIVDDSGGFSSVAAEFLEQISDEYRNIPILLYAARGPDSYTNIPSWKASMSKNLHDAISFSRLSSFCNLMVPLGLPSLSQSDASRFLCVDDAKPFHTSAVYAAALHSISLPFRMMLPGPSANSELIAGALDIGTMTQMLSGQAWQNMVTILDMAMPSPLIGERNEVGLHRSLRSLTPNIAEGSEDRRGVETMVIHGALLSGGSRASIHQVKNSIEYGYQNQAIRPLFSHLSTSLCPLPIPLPFPSIFGNRIGGYGEILEEPIFGVRARGSLGVSSIPMATRLRSSKAILPFIEKRLADIRKLGTARGSYGVELLQSWGFQKDEVDDMAEGLAKMAHALKDQPEISSDSD